MATAIDEDRLSETFAALANSTRRAILARLAQGETNVGDLAEPFDLTLPAISKHLKVLERAGLIVRGQRAQFRPCSLDPRPLAEISTWAERRLDSDREDGCSRRWPPARLHGDENTERRDANVVHR